MIKRSVSRNTRTQGIKVKHVLQILVLLGICVWLIFQVKHSRDKKRELINEDGQISGEMQNDPGLLKLGRKDLDPRDEKLDGGEKPDEEDEGETEEQDKEGENQDREEQKHEETENEGRGGRDEAGKEKDDDDEEIERDEKQSEEETSSEDHDRDENTRGAREEQYKGDDASSAVAHDARSIDSQTAEMISDLDNLEHKNGNSTLDVSPQNSNLSAAGPDQVSTQNPVSSESQQIETDRPAIVPVNETTDHGPVSDNTQSDQNPPISSKFESGNGTVVKLSNSSNETESIQSPESSSGPSEPSEEGAGTQNGSENPARDDPVDPSDPQIAFEMHENRLDLDTLPETRTEIDGSDETAAE